MIMPPLLALPPWAIRQKWDHFCLRHLTQGAQRKLKGTIVVQDPIHFGSSSIVGVLGL
jgi:hypothetical protein